VDLKQKGLRRKQKETGKDETENRAVETVV
jgi:hypothetical protein